LILFRDLNSFLSSLCYLGFNDELESLLNVESLKSLKVLQCFVFGAIKSGKTSFISGGCPKQYQQTKKQTSSVLPLNDHFLILTEFPDSRVMNVINSEEMSKCHVVSLLFDGSDQYSFSYLKDIQVEIFKKNSNLPCVYFETKSDLEQVEQVISRNLFTNLRIMGFHLLSFVFIYLYLLLPLVHFSKELLKKLNPFMNNSVSLL
jgi:GTPase SAR1 family protein